MRASSAKYLVLQGVKNLWYNRVMSFATFCIMMVSILMIGFSVLFVKNINLIIGGIEDKNEVSIYITDDASEADIQNMKNSLEMMDNISAITFYSKEEAFDDLKADMPDAEEIFAYIDESPLNDAYRVKVKDISQMNITVREITELSHVMEVTSPDDFVSLLMGVRRAVSLISITVISALIIVSFIIISNSARASVHTRRKEISIMKYVGATNGFIRIPFFIEGLTIGLLAGLVASLLTWLCYDSLIDILSSRIEIWNALGIRGFISFDSVKASVFTLYICLGGLVGSVGSAASVRKHTNV